MMGKDPSRCPCSTANPHMTWNSHLTLQGQLPNLQNKLIGPRGPPGPFLLYGSVTLFTGEHNPKPSSVRAMSFISLWGMGSVCLHLLLKDILWYQTASLLGNKEKMKLWVFSFFTTLS